MKPLISFQKVSWTVPDHKAESDFEHLRLSLRPNGQLGNVVRRFDSRLCLGTTSVDSRKGEP